MGRAGARRAIRCRTFTYALAFESNGVFRVEAVPPGSYQLTLAPPASSS